MSYRRENCCTLYKLQIFCSGPRCTRRISHAFTDGLVRRVNSYSADQTYSFSGTQISTAVHIQYFVDPVVNNQYRSQSYILCKMNHNTLILFLKFKELESWPVSKFIQNYVQIGRLTLKKWILTESQRNFRTTDHMEKKHRKTVKKMDYNCKRHPGLICDEYDGDDLIYILVSYYNYVYMFVLHVACGTRNDLIGSFALTELHDEQTISTKFLVELFHLYAYCSFPPYCNGQKQQFVF